MLTLSAADGWALGAEAFLPEGAAPKAAIVIAGATGVRRRYYAPFARWLATQGVAALTFDYRGIGDSQGHGPLRRSPVTMHDWGELDLEAALQHALQAWPGVPLALVGHSAGGQVLGLARSAAKLSAVFTVASQSGYWRHWSGLGRLRMMGVMFAAIPVLTPLVGHFPMGALGMGENLPPRMAHEWAAWCRDPGYVLRYARTRGGAHYAEYRGPWRACAIENDWYAPRRAVEALLAIYPNAKGEVCDLRPADAGGAPLNHFAFFREKFSTTLWPPALGWIRSQADF